MLRVRFFTSPARKGHINRRAASTYKMNVKLGLLVLIVSVAAHSAIGQSCQPGICSGIPGLVYNPLLDQCAWPDEVGCTLADAGYASFVCDGESPHDRLSPDFIVDGPPGTFQEQYFVVCVRETTPEDRALGRRSPTGRVVARLLGCPTGTFFNPDTKMCQVL